MSSHQDVSEDALPAAAPAPQIVSLGWALRRFGLWLLMMSAMVILGMWLFYASIDPDEATAGPANLGDAAQTSQ
ncbi:MAG TPA: hypothetical protein VJ740_17515 [Hyphomicrobiaceae bacterium]|nr:hypothetical protein [Hyphomicrobiaceae bacterium]